MRVNKSESSILLPPEYSPIPVKISEVQLIPKVHVDDSIVSQFYGLHHGGESNSSEF